MPTRPDCPPDAALARFASGDLDDCAAEALTDHLALCETCVTRLDRWNAAGQIPAGLRAGSGGSNAALARAVSQVLGEDVPPAAVNGYTVHEELGRGGMGRVFRAAHPRLPKDVAIKLLRPGAASKDVLTRFAAERRILARLDHPNIARVFDGGVDGDRPYVVMELVDGKPITAFAADAALPLPGRLALVAAVARAVHHAHQKGVIHRDLKPGNILVAVADGRPVPKVIDFGVALGTAVGDTRHTQHGTVVGTLEYMSPEQADPARADDVDTRSDVYALGVLLYELLTGRTPVSHDTTHTTPVLELLRRICEVDPPPPSRVPDGPVPAAAIPRDLDWVVMKALEKDPSRRYASAAAFADDLDRLSANEPVTAAPPGRGYRLKKFARRNRGGVIAASLLLTAVLLGAGATAWQAVRATAAEADAVAKLARAVQAEADAKAEGEKARAAEVDARADRAKAETAAAKADAARADTAAFSAFMRTYVLEAPRPLGKDGGRGIDITLAKALADAEPKIAAEFAGRPRAEAEVRYAVGSSFSSLGNFPLAEKNLRRAVELYETLNGPRDRYTLRARISWAGVLSQLDRAAEGTKLLEAELARFTAANLDDHRNAIAIRSTLLESYTRSGETAKAVTVAEQCREIAERALPKNDPMLDPIRSNLANAYQNAHRFSDARRAAEYALECLDPARPADDKYRISAEYALAAACANDRDPAEAIVLFEAVLPKMIRVEGDDHHNTISAKIVLAFLYGKSRNFEMALPMADAALASAGRGLPPFHTKALYAHYCKGYCLTLARDAGKLNPHLKAWAALLEAAPQPPSDAVRKSYAEFAKIAAAAGARERGRYFLDKYLASGPPDADIVAPIETSLARPARPKRELAPPPRPRR